MATQEFETAWADRLLEAAVAAGQITWTRFTSDDDEPLPEGVELMQVYTSQMPAASEAAASMLADPLPHLVRGIPRVSHFWSVQVERVNAERSLWGPRKLVIVWTLIPELALAKGVAYRIPR